jgi:hypothetical protein
MARHIMTHSIVGSTETSTVILSVLIPSVVTLSVLVLRVIMLSVIVMNVVVPNINRSPSITILSTCIEM